MNLLGAALPEVPYGPFEVVDDARGGGARPGAGRRGRLPRRGDEREDRLARWLDGRVTAVVGTHTHVQTNDARVQPGGTAAITDVGMTGPHDSVIGVKAELAIRRMRTAMPVRFEPAKDDVRIEGSSWTAMRTAARSPARRRVARSHARALSSSRRAPAAAAGTDQERREPDEHEVAREDEPGRVPSKPNA